MNWRIRSIFWLMTCCVIGINAFQGYWLWTTYQLNRQQFSQTVQDLLLQVLERQQVAQASRLLNTKSLGEDPKGPRVVVRRYNSSGEAGVGAEHTQVIINSGSGALRANGENTPSGRVVTYRVNVQAGDKPSMITADTLARRISSLVLLDWSKGGMLDLTRLETAYRTELERRGISSPFQLDTLTIRPRADGEDILIVPRNDEEKAYGGIRTLPAPVNPAKHLFARASFPSPASYLLGRMGWLLGSSVFLLLLTTGCFLFMLSTILRQKKLAEVKNDFINNMTHELKTPIATVTAAVEAMQHFGALADPNKTEKYLSISETNLHRLSDLVEKVLNLAVEEKRELVLHPEAINLYGLTAELIASHQVKAIKSVTFEVDIPADAVITVDRIHFGNALNNLIDNAIKYSHERVHIRLAYRPNEPGWQLSVTDNGIGIARTYQSVIFDRFFRVPTGDLHPVKGFGLGLAYVRQVVERHGGRIQVQSEPGKGSEFSIIL
ncbi:sensor histidine kinase [Spirosoma panaciterrae]|uniref:sensor histidine kinase n=1 Tax=Spirosoma panaciterrae TaxID=496058 RepID=UPI0003673FC4|nr:HAMP domain-containing sensor histidine kinase [Spirosoma panaciterrae]